MAWSQSHHMPWASDQRRKMLARIASIALYLLLIPTLVFDSAQSVYAQAECQLEAGADTCSGHQTDPGTTQSSKMHKRHVGNPIDAISGNKYQRGDDYIAFASPLVFFRHYNTADAHANQGMGQGWRHTYSLRLYQQAGEFHLIQSDGRKIVFNRLSEDGSSLTTGDDADGKLLQTTPMTWQQPNGQNWEFSGSYPIRLITAEGMSLSLTYRNKRLHTVTDDTGASLIFVYTEGENGLVRYSKDHNGEHPGHLSCLQLPDGSGVKYQYDMNKNLIAALHHSGNDWTYRYSDKRHVSHITEASYFPLRNSDPNNCSDHVPLAASSEIYKDALNVSQWTYDDDGRAISWIGNNPKQRIDVRYDVKYTDANVAEGFVFGSEVSQSIRERVYRYVPVVDDVTGDVGGIDIKAKECDGCGWEKLIDFEMQHSGIKHSELSSLIFERRKMIRKFKPREQAVSRNNFNRIVSSSWKRSRNITDEKLCTAWLAEIENTGNIDQHHTSSTACEELEKLVQSATAYGLNVEEINEIDIENIINNTLKNCPVPVNMTCSQLNEAILFSKLSGCSYDINSCPKDWDVVSPKSLGMNSESFKSEGFNAVLLFNHSRNEYVVSFEGTGVFSRKDWSSNLNNYFGFDDPEQYSMAAALSSQLNYIVSQLSPDAKLTFTGHSLGGGLASIASLATKNEAKIFNSAAVHPKTLSRLDVNYIDHENLVESVYHVGDPLANKQLGKQAYVPGVYYGVGSSTAGIQLKFHKLAELQSELSMTYAQSCKQNKP